MKKSLLMISFMLLLFTSVQAQLIVKSGSKGLYIDHTVAAKENFYSIGRLYNVHPKHIAAFNGLNMANGLNLGQDLMIPLSDTNFNQKDQNGVPVYYVVGEKDGLYRISAVNNKVAMESIKKWNKLTGDKVNTGQKIVVGFLVTKEAEKLATVKAPEVKEPSDARTIPNSDIVKNDEAKKQVTQTDETKTPELKRVDVKNEEPKKEEEKKPVTEEKKIVADDDHSEPQPIMAKDEMKTNTGTGGYFKISFEQQVKEQPVRKDLTVTAGIFKTTSGWTDQKYYVLVDAVEPGTIVRITNPVNGKIVFAKVLGEMAGMKQNLGLNIRMSNAAAAALDIPETDKFIVRLNY
jgi:LysM repeat protein